MMYSVIRWKAACNAATVEWLPSSNILKNDKDNNDDDSNDKNGNISFKFNSNLSNHR